MTIRDIQNVDELVDSIAEDITEIPDDTEVSYEIWAMGYDSEKSFTTEMLIGDYSDPDKAVEAAAQLTISDILHQAEREDYELEPITDTAFISVEVETVILDGEDTMNIGTVYKKELWI